jgi:hypothetical protein
MVTSSRSAVTWWSTPPSAGAVVGTCDQRQGKTSKTREERAEWESERERRGLSGRAREREERAEDVGLVRPV